MVPRYSVLRVKVSSTDSDAAIDPELGVTVHAASPALCSSCSGTENFAGNRDSFVSVAFSAYPCRMKHSPKFSVRDESDRFGTQHSALIGMRASASPTPGTSITSGAA